MLKRTITYEDFNDQSHTGVFYFNLSKTELLELGAEYEGDLETTLQAIVDRSNAKEIISEFKKIILLSYGEKSEDGQRFVKTEEIREAFAQSPAFDVLFFDLVTNITSVKEFVRGVMPKELADKIDSHMPQDKPLGPPPRPPAN